MAWASPNQPTSGSIKGEEVKEGGDEGGGGRRGGKGGGRGGEEEEGAQADLGGDLSQRGEGVSQGLDKKMMRISNENLDLSNAGILFACLFLDPCS